MYKRQLLVTVAGSAQFWRALAFQAESRAGLRSCRNLELDVSVDGFDFDFIAQSRLNEADVLIKVDFGTVTTELFALINDKDNEQVTVRTTVKAGFALSLQAHLIAVFNAGRNLDLNGMLLSDVTCAMASRAFFLDFFAGAMTNVAFLLSHYAAKRRLTLNLDESASAAVRTGNGTCPGLGTAAVAR